MGNEKPVMVECKPFEQAARLTEERISFLRDYWRGCAILNANMAAEFRTSEDHYSQIAAIQIDTAAALFQLASNFDALQQRERKLVEALTEFFEKFEQRKQAYPTDVFPEVKFSELQATAKAAGISVDRISASNFRWMVNSIAKDLAPIRAALRSSDHIEGEQK